MAPMTFPVLLVATVAVGALLAWLTARAVRRTRAEEVHFQGNGWWSVAIVAVAFAPMAWIETSHRLFEARLTGAAEQVLARDDLTVRCQRLSGTMLDTFNRAGWVPFPGDGSLPTEAYLSYETCRSLKGWDSGRAAFALEEATAVHVLAHEIGHLAGQVNEAITECEAMQTSHEVARALGAPEAVGRAMAAAYWTHQYPLQRIEYRSADCAPGAGMDLDPTDPRFP